MFILNLFQNSIGGINDMKIGEHYYRSICHVMLNYLKKLSIKMKTFPYVSLIHQPYNLHADDN